MTPCGLYSDKTFEEYCTQIPEFYFRNEVPDDVIKSFEVVKSLLAHSYFNYLYIDEAYSKALRVFEMAMKLRLIELGEDASEWTFFRLSKKLLELNMFDSNDTVLDYTRFVRNHFSHPKHHSFAGIIYWNRISIVPTLINELYEDVSLRTVRQTLRQEFSELIKWYELENESFLELGDEVYLLHSILLLFVNNKVTPHTYQLMVVPIFDLTQKENEIIVPRVFELVINNPNFSKDSLEAFECGTSQKILIAPIKNRPQYLHNYNEWKIEYGAKPDIVKFLYNQGIKSSIPELYKPVIDTFQKL